MGWLKKFKCAFEGIISGLKQRSIRIQLLLALLATLVFIYLKISYFEWLVFVLVCALVVCLEWVNTVFEEVVDYISLETHPHAKKIKDLSAGLVLMACIFAVIVGIMILLNHR